MGVFVMSPVLGLSQATGEGFGALGKVVTGAHRPAEVFGVFGGSFAVFDAFQQSVEVCRVCGCEGPNLGGKTRPW